MTSPPNPVPSPIAVRVGITGTRSILPEETDRLQRAVRHVLETVDRILKALVHERPELTDPYRNRDGAVELVCRFISPLARGADRLAAREALALGWELHVPTPFPATAYEQDFEPQVDLAEFRRLLARAGTNCLALDGDRDRDRERAYEAVGRYVVRHSDVLIAIWDGEPSKGRGGAADMVRFSTMMGVPVWWVHATEDRSPHWIHEAIDLHAPRAHEATAEEALAAYLTEQIVPPKPARSRSHSRLAAVAAAGRNQGTRPELRYIRDELAKPRFFWRAYEAMILWTSGSRPMRRPTEPATDTLARYWADRHLRADALAGQYGARYRSTYVWVLLLGTLAVALGALSLLSGLVPEGRGIIGRVLPVLPIACAAGELAALGLILLLVFVGFRYEWHERFLEYRLFAELCRKEQAIAPLGATMPLVAVRNIVASDRAAWVSWLFAAEQRAAPFPTGDLSEAAKHVQTVETLIRNQLHYHEQRAHIAGASAHRLERGSENLFVAVVLCVLAKIVLAAAVPYSPWEVLLGLLATVLPAMSGALVGIRAYAELQLLADQSRHMTADLQRALDRLRRMGSARPLLSQELSAEAVRVAALLLQELDGWSRVFRVKVMETG